MLIKTERLTIRLASDDEMRQLIADENDEDIKQAYREMFEFSVSNPEKRQWYAAWFIEHDGLRVGDLCFKGLDTDGRVEIGYGLLPEFWGRGYATEAVRAIIQWALIQPGVIAIEAEIEVNNVASRRVLEKSGFVPTGQIGAEGPRYVWRGLV